MKPLDVLKLYPPALFELLQNLVKHWPTILLGAVALIAFWLFPPHGWAWWSSLGVLLVGFAVRLAAMQMANGDDFTALGVARIGSLVASAGWIAVAIVIASEAWRYALHHWRP